jgi:lipid-A-disaccharide synthase
VKVLISAGEPSGDQLGAQVLATLEGPEFEGLAGPAMRAAGVHPLARVEDLSVMGVTEVIAALPRILGLRRTMMQALERQPALFVGIDAPDFNLPLARRARALGIPVMLIGAPQVWAWRGGRAKGIAECSDRIVCLLPFEPPYFQKHGGDAVFLGHPASADFPDLGPPGEDWALLPGSRRAEIQRLLPDMLKAAHIVLEAHPGTRVRLPVAPGLDPALLRAAEKAGIELVGTLEQALRPARAALVASGTASLQVACSGRPQAICYRVAPLTYSVGKTLVRGIEHIGLPNLILDDAGIPERIQRFDPAELAAVWQRISGQQQGLSKRLHRVLRSQGAAGRIGQCLMELL